MPTIHEKIECLIADKGLTKRKTAEMAGIKYSTFHSAMTSQRKMDFETIDAIAKALHVDIRFFSQTKSKVTLEPSSELDDLTSRAISILDEAFQAGVRSHLYAGKEISLEAFLNWWFASRGRLEYADQLIPYIDLFNEPAGDAKRIQPLQTGPQSLASVCFDVQHPGHLVETLEGFDGDINARLLNAHREALEKGEPVISHPSLDVNLRDGKRFTRRYRRVLAPVTLADGTTLIANYSQDIRAQ